MRGWLACTTALLLAPAAAGAQIFTHGIGSEGYWTDNVYSTSEDTIDDGAVRVLPWGQVEDRDGDLTGSFRYGPSYDYYFQESDIRGFDHDAVGSLQWRMTPRTTLSLTDGFRRNHTVARFNELAQPGGDLVTVSRRDAVVSNQFDAVLQHSFTPVDLVSVSASYGIVDLSGKNGTDSEYVYGGFFYQRLLSERTRLGGRVSVSRQTAKPGDPLEGAVQQPDRDTDYYNASAVLGHDFSPTLHLTLSAGPALVRSDQQELGTAARVIAYPLLDDGGVRSFVDANTCPTNKAGDRIFADGCQAIEPARPLTDPQFQFLSTFNATTVPVIRGSSVDDSSSTYFADVSIAKEWERVTGSLTYRRSEDRTSTLGAISDILFGRARWEISAKLSTSLLASYERRSLATQSQVFLLVVANGDAPLPAYQLPPPPVQVATAQFARASSVDTDASIDVTNVSWLMNYQFAERAELYSIVAYRDESPSAEAANLFREVNRFTLTIGVRYAFDPIPF